MNRRTRIERGKAGWEPYSAPVQLICGSEKLFRIRFSTFMALMIAASVYARRAAIQWRVPPEVPSGAHSGYSLPMVASPASLARFGSLCMILGEPWLAQLATQTEVSSLHSRDVHDSAKRAGHNIRLRLKTGLHLGRCGAATLLFELNRQHQGERQKVGRLGRLSWRF